MNLFLRAKHWQLFLAGIVAPFAIQIVTTVTLVLNVMQKNDSFNFLTHFCFSFATMMLLFMGTMLGWQWAIVTRMQKMLPVEIAPKLTLYKIFFFIPVVYLLSILILMPVLFSNVNSNTADPALFFIGFAVIFPVHLFSMFCLFYGLYFVARTFKMAELQRPVTFSDYAGEFFLIWFFPIGVWIIQPRVNRMVKQYAEQIVDPVETTPAV